MISAAALSRRAYQMFARVFPRCSMISQAIAFNLFVAFFPALLIAVALATSRIGGKTSLFDLITDLTQFLPPGSQGIVSEFLVRRGPDAWKIAVLGWTGTLLAGSQVMKLVMEGIHTIYGDAQKPGFLNRQVRGLMLLLVTIAPLLGAAESSPATASARALAGSEIRASVRPRRWCEFLPSPASSPAILQATSPSSPARRSSMRPARA